LGLDIIPEDVSNTGNVDFTVLMDNGIFVFEIKIKSGTHKAMKQLEKKKYHEKYLSEKKDIFLVGIEFDKKIKNISSFECKNVRRQK